MDHDLIDEICAADLVGPVSRLLGRPVRAIVDWRASAIEHRPVTPVTGGLTQVAGTAACDDGNLNWSIVLKVCTRPPDALGELIPADLRSRIIEAHRWDREPLAYESSLLADLGGGLVAPRFLGLRREDTVVWLWLEDVAHDPAPWRPARYQLAARHLGQFNGLYLASRSLPSYDWLSRRWLQGWAGSLGPSQLAVLDADTVWEAPMVREAFAVSARAELREALAEQSADHRLLDALPQTLCHLDPFRPNLMSRAGADGRTETVAVDWAYVGIAPIGADASQLATIHVPDLGDAITPEEREAAVWEGYLEGLEEVGWQGDVRVARVGYLASNVVRWMFAGVPALAAVMDRAAQIGVEQEWHMEFPEFVAYLAARTGHLLAQARELRALLPGIAL